MAKFNFAFVLDEDDDFSAIKLAETPGTMGWDVMFRRDTADWTDYLAEMQVVEEPPSCEGWAVVARVERVMEAPRAPRWCRLGNSCPRGDCRFRHERCGHYDAWVARGKRGHNCRAMETDPRSVKSPEDGGCKYDHRDPRDLTVTPVPLPVGTETELLDSFALLGLDCLAHGSFGFSHMREADKKLLVRSLNAAHVSYEEHGDYMTIEVVEEGPMVDMSTLPVSSKNQILESFGAKGLTVTADEVAIGCFYDVTAMTEADRAMLRRSLRWQNCEGEMCENLIFVV